MSVRILHASDFHLESPFYSLPQEKAVQRRREQRELLDSLAAAVEESRAQVVLLAGDLFDSGTAYWETSEAITRVLSQIKAEIFISPATTTTIRPVRHMRSWSCRQTYIFQNPINKEF